MTRFVSNDPLSRGPRGSFGTSSGGIRVPNVLPVHSGKAGAIAEILTKAVGAYAGIQQVKQAQDDRTLGQEYESSRAQLIRLQHEAERDPDRQDAFLTSYNAMADKFAGTRYEADIAQFGEGTISGFQQQAERRAALATTGFYNTRVLPAVQEALLDEREQERLLAIEDYTDRQIAVEGLIYQHMPDDMPKFLGQDGDMQMGQMVQESAARLNDRLQGAFEDRITEAKKQQDLLAIRGSTSRLTSGSADYATYSREMEALKVSPTEYEQNAAASLYDAMVTSALSGDKQSLHTALRASHAALESIQDPAARRKIAEGISLGQQGQAMLDMEAIGTIWSETYKSRGVAAANAAVDQTARDMLFLEYGNEAYEVDDIKRLPGGGFRGDYLNSVLRAVSAVSERAEAVELPQKVQTAISDFLQPATAADGDPAAMLKFTLEERTQFLGTLAQATQGDPDYARLLADAVTDPAKYAAVVADRFAGTRHESQLVNYMLTPSSGYLQSDDGVQILYDTLQQLGGVAAIDNHVDDKATAAALRRAFTTRQISAAAISQYKQQYEQIAVDVGEKAPVGMSQAIQSKAFTQAFFGTGGFWGGDESVSMDPTTAGKIAAMVPLDSLPQGEFGVQKLADLVKTNMANAGMYLVRTPSGGPGSRDRFGIVHSTTIPEVIGKTTQQVESGLNNPESPMARYLGFRMAGTSQNIWDLAAQRYTEAGLTDYDQQTVKTELLKLLESKQAVIRIRTLQADQTGAPVTLQLFERGKEPQEVLLGKYNFNDGFLNSVGPTYFRTPDPRKGSRDDILRRASEIKKGDSLWTVIKSSVGASPFNPF